MSRRVVVIGVGNRWRGDDGIGPAVIDSGRNRWSRSVDVVESDGEAAGLVDAWDGADLAIVVDAVRCGAAPGTVHRLGPDSVGTRPVASSHRLGVAYALALGRVLGRVPARLEVIGVEGSQFEPGAGLSPPVAAAVAPTCRLVSDLLVGSR